VVRMARENSGWGYDASSERWPFESPLTPHMIRHTVATLLLRFGADIRVLQEVLGHASIATTHRYTHISKDHLLST
jgi:site-specific recombinase XerD